jgi:hypothetical protein
VEKLNLAAAGSAPRKPALQERPILAGEVPEKLLDTAPSQFLAH